MRLESARCVSQICPARVNRFDESDFLTSAPALNLLLSGDGIRSRGRFFGIDETINVVFGGERRPFSGHML